MDEFIISQYMTINWRIEQLKRKKVYKRWAFYQQSFYTSIGYTGYEVISQSIRADKAIERLDETLRVIDHRIEILKMKQGFWNKFLSSLTGEERAYFHNKYVNDQVCLNTRLEHLATEEIGEINEAVAMRFCTMNEPKEKSEYVDLIENDFSGNLDKLLNALEGA